ncbi:MAG TPA: conjugal transfer protein [Streptosporangiaceae bacterium]
MDLPTYTNIWRIEKRLYKLYDFRLPMPLPIGQVAVFAAITVPYVVTLTVLGLPFSHTLVWVYLLPPGLLTWLVTRPVLESKRLPELVGSQLRYLGQPRTWCRMAPLAEKDEITIICRVWRASPSASALPAQSAAAIELAETAAAAAAKVTGAAPARTPATARPAAAAVHRGARDSASGLSAAGRSPGRPAAANVAAPAEASRLRQRERAPARPAVTGRARQTGAGSGTPGRPAPPAGAAPAGASRQAPQWPFAGMHAPAPSAPATEQPQAPAAARAPAEPTVGQQPAEAAAAVPAKAVSAAPAPAAAPGVTPAQQASVSPEAAVPAKEVSVAPRTAAARTATPAQRPQTARPPAVTVRATGESRPGREVERALAAPSAQRPNGWRDHVVVVPGGHRPGQPGRPQRDQARAVLPVAGPRRIVVLGCTVGAGQTVTALMTGETLAALRSDQVAVLDLNPGPASLAERARSVPALPLAGGQSGQQAATRLEVISRGDAADPAAEQHAGRIFELVSARYPLTFADPAAAAVPKVLAIADQLVLVAPASEEAARAIAMTYEWLEAHGHAALAAAAVTVLNGVSAATLPHVQHAESVASGRCRAIVRVPWDNGLKDRQEERGLPLTPEPHAPDSAPASLSQAAVHAYTALAGVLVAGLAEPATLSGARA